MFVALLVLGGQTSSILSNVRQCDRQHRQRRAPLAGGGTAGSNTTGEPAPPDQSGGQVADANATAPELLIIRTGQLTIEVGDLNAATAAARERVAAAGGFVSGSDQTAGGDDASAAVTFRIPASRWERRASPRVRGLATTTRNLHVETEAVTTQVVDLGARITNLRATEAALQAIMVKATKIPDVLDVQAKLTDVRGEIERLVAEKTHLEEQACLRHAHRHLRAAGDPRRRGGQGGLGSGRVTPTRPRRRSSASGSSSCRSGSGSASSGSRSGSGSASCSHSRSSPGA